MHMKKQQTGMSNIQIFKSINAKTKANNMYSAWLPIVSHDTIHKTL